MAYQQANRVLEHPEAPELENLSLLARQILLVIALKTNPTNPEKMRFSNAHLAYLTGATENAVQRATKALIECGAVSGHRERPRAATVYTLLLECPSDCTRKRNHYTALELKQRRSMTHSESVSDPAKEGIESEFSEGLSPLKVVTNKQLTNKPINNLNKQPVEFAERKPARDFSLGEFVKILDETKWLPEFETLDHSLVIENPERAYEVALLVIEQTRAKRGVSDPVALIRRIYEVNPRRLLGGAPGTKPRNPDFKAEALAGTKQRVSRDDYFLEIDGLCKTLGIDYEETFAATTADKDLWVAFTQGKLTLSLVAITYNKGKSASEWLQPENVNLY